MDNNQIIQSFWHSKDPNTNSFSTLELLCIASFLHHGHQFHLYTYTPNDCSMQYLKNELKECKNFKNFHIKDAREVLPESEIFLIARKTNTPLQDLVTILDTTCSIKMEDGGWI